MKKHAILLALLVSVVIAPGIFAQSLVINSVSASQFCVGDSLTVRFTASGTFGHNNAFTLQLSDPSGSFMNFQNIGSIKDTVAGTYSISYVIPSTLKPSSSYRFRVMAAIPYTLSADNGSDVAVWGAPISLHSLRDDGFIGRPIKFRVTINKNKTTDDVWLDKVYWNFGDGATPSTATSTGEYDPQDIQDGIYDYVNFMLDVTYSTTGDKTISVNLVNAGGCSSTAIWHVRIYDCRKPSIPKNAIVINSDTSINDASETFWLNPGVTLTLNSSYDTIFAEPGSSIVNPHSSLLYMKQGSAVNSGNSNTIISDNGTSIDPNSSGHYLNCSGFDFDYSSAPPNVAHPLSSVKDNLTSAAITLSPNPTSGLISIQGLSLDNVTVSVYNILGENVLEKKNPPAPEFSLDISKLIAGTYYIRFSFANSVVTKKIIKK